MATLLLSLDDWLKPEKLPLVIAGPCSAETKEQVLATAIEVAKIPQVKIFRAGVWKPRTRPGSFEGVGIRGLQWLQQVKKETGLMTTVEVAGANHVEAALNHGIDILWIGARTVVSPFSMQEIATALRGTDIPVMIKNPVHPDLGLWLGAIERIQQSGIQRVIAIHRGFYFFRKSSYRNAPMWEIPIELKRLRPDLPIICDPSHISGRKDLIMNTAQKALDLEMDGLMIETHIQPEKALTDARQQITPAQLATLLSKLVLRNISATTDFQNKLEELRSDIDVLDSELIDIIARRMDIIREIGKYKKENNITILQLNRWRHIINDWLEKGNEVGLEREFILKFLEVIHKESIRIQTELMK